MPPRRKRRADQISRDPSESEPEPPRRRRATSASASASAAVSGTDDSFTDSDASSSGSEADQPIEQILIKKVVRLALASEYSRSNLRRNDISQQIWKDANINGGWAAHKRVFDGAQRVLEDVFGMQLEELPAKEKTSLKDRRAQVSQTKSSSSSTGTYMLVSTLPAELKRNPLIAQPTRAPNVGIESGYTGLYTTILALIYLNNRALTDQRLEVYLQRLNANTYTPLGSTERLLQRMMKEGYIDKRRDTTSGEEIIEWTPGPRGKIEVGVEGVAGLVKTVYGYGAVPTSRERRPNNQRLRNGNVEDAGPLADMSERELDDRLSRSLGVRIGEGGAVEYSREDVDGEAEGDMGNASDDDDDDDDDGQPGPSRRTGLRSRPDEVGDENAQPGPSRRTGRSGLRSRRDEDEDEDQDEDAQPGPSRRTGRTGLRSRSDEDERAQPRSSRRAGLRSRRDEDEDEDVRRGPSRRTALRSRPNVSESGRGRGDRGGGGRNTRDDNDNTEEDEEDGEEDDEAEDGLPGSSRRGKQRARPNVSGRGRGRGRGSGRRNAPEEGDDDDE